MTDFNEVSRSKSDRELLKMIYELDQWSPEMLTAVEKELVRRNILPDDIGEHRQKMIENEDRELSKGKDASLVGIIVGWLTILGLVGIIVGYNYAFSKVRSRYSGKEYFKYSKESRKDGEYIFYTAIIIVTLTIGYQLIK
jgi:hypothetical protein